MKSVFYETKCLLEIILLFFLNLESHADLDLEMLKSKPQQKQSLFGTNISKLVLYLRFDLKRIDLIHVLKNMRRPHLENGNFGFVEHFSCI